MKRHLGIVAFAVAALACGMAFSQNPPAQDPAPQRVDKFETELAATRLRVEALSAEVADLKKQVASAVAYIATQAKSAAAMAAILDESEKAGFTYGLNPDSRHVLLRGWREQLAAAQKDVPVIESKVVPPVQSKPAATPDPKASKTPAKTGT